MKQDLLSSRRNKDVPHRIAYRVRQKSLFIRNLFCFPEEPVESTTTASDLQKAYHELLRNISRGIPRGLIANNANAATFNPYLSQTKSLKEIHTSGATDDAKKSSNSDVDSPHTSPLPAVRKNKNPKKLLKKYLQPNRTVTASRLPSVESKLNEETSTGDNELSKGHLGVPSERSKNASLSAQSPSRIYSNPTTEGSGNRREWNLHESSTAIPSFISPLNASNTYSVLNVYALNNLNVPSDANTLHLPSRYNAVPRPFTISQLPHSPVTNNLVVSQRKPSPSSVNVHPQPIARSSGNVLPLVLPTDLFNPTAARRYVPIKRANRLNSNGKPATIVNAEASPATSPLGGGITLEKPSADYRIPYTDVIGTSRSPPVAANGHQSSVRSDYYPITDNPAERSVAETAKAATAYVSRQTSTLQRPKGPQVVRRNDFLPRIDTHGSPDDERSDPNFNIGLALYNKFANLYSVNAPKEVAQDYYNFQKPASHSHAATVPQQVPALPYYVTLKPNSASLPKTQPIPSGKLALAPYYDSRLFVLQHVRGKESSDEDGKESIKKNKQSSLEDEDETEDGAVDDKRNPGNYQTQINHEAPKDRKTKLDHEREEDHSEEDRHQQQSRDYKHEDRQRYRDENDERERNENIRSESEEDEEEPDGTHEDGYISSGESENGRNRGYYHQYGKQKYEQEDSEEEQQDDNQEENEKRKAHRDKSDRRADVKQKGVSKEKYSYDSRYNNDENYNQDKERHDRRKSARNDRCSKKNRQDRGREDPEDESVAEDKVIAQRSKSHDGHQEHHLHQRAKDYHDHRRNDGSHDNHHGDQQIHDHVHGETQEHAHKHEEHHEKKKDGGNHDFKEGEGAEFEKEHHGHEGEKGHKVNSSFRFIARVACDFFILFNIIL